MQFSKRIMHFLKAIRAVDSADTGNAGPFCCPIHTDFRARNRSKTLHVSIDPDLGLILRCTSNKCAYVGDAVHTLARVRNIKASSAVVKFQDGEEFEGALYPVSSRPMDAARINVYKSELCEHQEIIDFMEAAEVFASKYSGPLRMALNNAGIRFESLIGNGCGVSNSKFLRSAITVPSKLKYHLKDLANDVLLLPYYHAHVLTGITIFSPIDGTCKHVKMRKSHCGLMLSEHFSWPKVSSLICVDDALEAIKLNSKLKSVSPIPLNITRPLHPSSIAHMNGLEKVLLLDVKGSHLTFADALPYARLTDESNLEVSVCSLSGRRCASKMSSRDLRNTLQDTRTHVNVWDYLALELAEAFESDEMRGVHDVLNFAKITLTEQRTLLLKLEDRDVSKDVIESVKSAPCRADDVQLGACIYQRNIDHYAVVAPSHRILSDFAVYLDYITSDEKGDLIYVGKVKTTLADEELYPVSIAAKSLSSRGKASNLGTIIWNQIKQQGSQARVFCESVDSSDWATVIRAFDDVPYIPAATALGGDTNGIFHLPQGSIKTYTGNIVRSGTTGLAVPEVAAAAYKLVPPTNTPEDLAALRQLLSYDSATVIPYVIYLASVAANAAIMKHDGGYIPLHVALPYTGKHSLWESELRRLNAAKCGAPLLHSGSDKLLTKHQYMGTLPLMCGYSSATVNTMYSTTTPMITLMPDDVADSTLLSGGNITVVAPDTQAFKSNCIELSPKAVNHIVACTGWAVNSCATLGEMADIGKILTACIGRIYEALELDVPAAIRSCFDPITTRNDDMGNFFTQLRKVTADRNLMSPSFKHYAESPSSIGVLSPRGDNKIWLSYQKVANTINAEFGTKLSNEKVRKLLQSVKGHTEYRNQYCTFGSISISYWDTYILLKPSLFDFKTIRSSTSA